jgi:Flp pilus assembly pilin Flp
MLLKLYVMFQDLQNRQDGQDLVEYALTVALIAFGAVAGMGVLATGLEHFPSYCRPFKQCLNQA